MALDALNKAVELDPQNPSTYRQRAWLHDLLEKYEDEIADLPRAIEREQTAAINSHSGLFWYTLGVCHYSRGDYEAARAACQRAIEMRNTPYTRLDQPRVATDYDQYAGFFLAMSLWHLGEKEKGREAYAESIAWRDEQTPDAESRSRFSAEKRAVDALAKQRAAAEAATSDTQRSR